MSDEETPLVGQCDCCGKERELAVVWAFGIETAACWECRHPGEDHDEDNAEFMHPHGQFGVGA